MTRKKRIQWLLLIGGGCVLGLTGLYFGLEEKYDALLRSYHDYQNRARIAKMELEHKEHARQSEERVKKILVSNRIDSEIARQTREGSIKEALALIVKHKLPEIQQHFGPPLRKAFIYRRTALIIELLNRGAQLPEDPLEIVARYYGPIQTDDVDKVLTAVLSVSPRAKEQMKAGDHLGLFAQYGNHRAVKHYIRAGANLEKLNEYTGTPLNGAVRYQKLQATQLLVEAGANPFNGNSELVNAIMTAVSLPSPEKIMAILLKTKEPIPNSIAQAAHRIAHCKQDKKTASMLEDLTKLPKNYSAVDLSNFGERLEEAGLPDQNILLQKCALRKDPKLKPALLRLAIASAKSLYRESTAEGRFYTAIINPLRTLATVDPEHKSKIIADQHLKVLEGTVFLSVLKGEFDPKNEADIRALLPKKRWVNGNPCAHGMFASEMRFHKDGSVTAGCTNGGDPKPIATSYRVSGTTIFLKNAKNKETENAYHFKFNGTEAMLSAVTGREEQTDSMTGWKWNPDDWYEWDPLFREP